MSEVDELNYAEIEIKVLANLKQSFKKMNVNGIWLNKAANSLGLVRGVIKLKRGEKRFHQLTVDGKELPKGYREETDNEFKARILKKLDEG